MNPKSIKNKSDLEDQRVISKERGENLAKENTVNDIKYIVKLLFLCQDDREARCVAADHITGVQIPFLAYF